MMSDRSNVKVSLEDLLRLKRAEHPPAEFWGRFEQELRAKQLAAIVEKRPWWQFDLSRAWTSFSKLHIPLGATAVLALTFLTVREYQDGTIVRSGLTPVDSALATSTAADVHVGDMALVPAAATVVAAPDASAELAPSKIADESAIVAGIAPASPTEGTSSTSWIVNTLLAPGGAQELTPSARSIAANLAAAEDADLQVGQPLEGRNRGFEMARLSRSSTMDPLAQVTAPTESRRARLAAYVTAANLNYGSNAPAVDKVRERMTSRLNEQELYESVSRLGVGGDRLILKF